MSVRSDKSDYARRPICTLKEFVECYPYPQLTRLAQDHRVDIVGHQPLLLRRGTTVTIRNKTPTSVPMSCIDPYSLTVGRQQTFAMRTDVRHRFRLLPYDPATADMSPDHVYSTVQELVQAWPPEAIVRVAVHSSDNTPMLVPGDCIRLTRRVWFNSETYLECRRLPHPGVCLLPMDVIGKFNAVFPERPYTLSELLAMPSRKRRLQLVPNALGKLPQLAGLPEGFFDDLYLEEVSVCAECSTPSLQGLNFELHAHIRVYLPQSASSDNAGIGRGHLLREFCVSNRFVFPVVVQVTDWDEETYVLENAGVRPGSTLVFHDTQDVEKVLCVVNTSSQQQQHYALPITYPGTFVRPTRVYESVGHVNAARTFAKLRVTDVHAVIGKCAVKVGDVVQLRESDSSGSVKRREPDTTKFYKYDPNKPGAKPKDIKLPSEAPIRFEEISTSQNGDRSAIESRVGEKLTDFIPMLNKEKIILKLDQGNPETKFKDRDLPSGTKITIEDKVKETGVVVSWEHGGGSVSSSSSSSSASRFVIPLRTKLFVKFVMQANDGGRQQQQQQGRGDNMAPSVHCPELLSLATFTDLRQRRGDLILLPENEALRESRQASIRLQSRDSIRQQHASPLLQQVHLNNSMRSLSARSLNSPLTNGQVHTVNGTLGGREGRSRVVRLVPVQPLSRSHSLSSPINHHVATLTRNSDTRSMASLRGDDDDRASVVTYRNFPQVRLVLPKDGNLIGFTALQMAELLRSLRIDDAIVDNLLKRGLDGPRFSKLTSNDLRALNLLHPVVIYFRRLTRKKMYL